VETHKQELTAEVELVLLLSDPLPPEAGLARLEELVVGTHDWNRVLGLLHTHRTAGTAWCNLVRLGFEVMERIKPAYLLHGLELTHRAQRLYADDQLTRTVALMREFDAAGIDCVMLKGAAVARMAYPDTGMRFFGDNDLLFRRSDIGRVGEILRGAGYRQGRWNATTGEIVPASRREIMLHSVHAHETFPYLRTEPDARIATVHEVDVHFSVDLLSSNNTDESVARILDRRSEVDGVAGAPLWTPHAEDMFVFVAVHFEREATHMSEVGSTRDLVLYKLLDLLAMLGSTTLPLDPGSVVRRAAELGLGRELYFGLYYLDVLYPGRVPAELLEAARPEETGYLHQLRDNSGPVHTWRAALTDRFFDSRRQDELADKLAEWSAANA